MSAKVALVTGQITINDGGSFLLMAADGSIDDLRDRGFFVRDTRLISYYGLSSDRRPLTLLTSGAIAHRVARYEFPNPKLFTAHGIVPAKKLLVSFRPDKGTLLKLAQLQSAEFNDWQDAEPGKMLHELRRGKLVQLNRIPSEPY